LGDTAYDAVYVGIKGLNAANGSTNPLDAMDADTRKIVEQLLASTKP
jgi:hypothetical protein